MNWVAYCVDCAAKESEGESFAELENCPNGHFAEAAARHHHRETGHRVIVGYFYEEEKEDS